MVFNKCVEWTAREAAALNGEFAPNGSCSISCRHDVTNLFFFFAEAKFGITSDKGMVGTVFFYEVIYSF